ncbi:MAG: sugar ABC transporter permease [Clostridia bacterium]|nr:sugar ABC transporter permease [Clostridia bacterium]
MNKLGLKIKRTIKESYTGWLFNLPLIIGIAVFTLTPVLMSFYDSFFRYDGLNNPDSRLYIGLDNYTRIFTADKVMGKVVLNTVVYTAVSIPINLVAAYFLALLVNNRLKGVRIFRVLYYLPCMIPAVAGGLLWADMFDSTFGVFNKVLGIFGLGPYKFFRYEDMRALIAVLVMNLWIIGGGMVLWLSAFKNIGEHYYEAAKLDGANAWHRLIYITIPLSTAMIFYNVITSIIGTLQYNGTLTFATRNGRGDGDALYMYAVKIYYEAFEKGKIGYASALAWILLIVIALITVILFKTSRWVFYAEEN